MSHPIALLCSDLHLSLRPPVARAGESDWLEAQARPLRELAKLSQDNGDIPILCAGDIFDRWNSPPELINWALEYLPKMYAIPGQHDMPFHSRELMDKSAYMTLVKASAIVNLEPGELHGIKEVAVGAFPWGEPLRPNSNPLLRGQKVRVALVHRYIWTEGASYPGAPQDSHVMKSLDGMEGWDVMCFGDNHKGFIKKYTSGQTVFNCGTLMRRKTDEAAYVPQVGVLFSDGRVEPYRLDIRADNLTAGEVREAAEDMELKQFLEELTKLQESNLDFVQAMKKVLEERRPAPAVRELVLKAMEEK